MDVKPGWTWRVDVENGRGEWTWRMDVKPGWTWRVDVESGPSVEPGRRHSRRIRVTHTTRARKNYAIPNFVGLLMHWLNLAIG